MVRLGVRAANAAHHDNGVRIGDGQPEREAAASVEHDDGVEIVLREHVAHDVGGVVQMRDSG